MGNGQLLSLNYHLNWPLYFNRLLCKFNGDFLLLGGGTICECEAPQDRHPQDLFYSIDIDNAHLPDMVAHGGYLQHLFFFPSERFSFIWFEHYTPVEIMQDIDVFKQYFRFAKPGCIFLFQSNYLIPDKLHEIHNGEKKTHEEVTRVGFNMLASLALQCKFAILENTVSTQMGKDKIEYFIQLVLMKPLHVQDGPYFKYEDGVIFNLDNKLLSNFRKPTEKEQECALIRCKVWSNQEQLVLRFSLEKLLSWITLSRDNNQQDTERL